MKLIFLLITLSFSALVAAFFIPKSQKTITPENVTSTHHPSLINQSQVSQSQINQSPDQPELGQVHWLRDLDAGRAESQKSGKPILLLFQEVPGCSNCTRFGNNTLSHPLIVEAIETYFVPVCIFNNKGGKDAEALKTFDEPAWNNPVVRIVRANNQDVVLRMPDFNSSLQLVNGMRRALDLTGVIVPRYLEHLEEELAAREAGLQTATFSMYCFWTGEGAFGSISGVIETEPGYQDGKEVVKVQFDPSVTSRTELEKLTQPKSFSACSKNEGFRSDREPKYYLAQTAYRFVPMTSLQASRANTLVGKGQSPEELFSPRQLSLLKKVSENPKKDWKNMIGRSVNEMWSM
ncbi:MAG: thioredoxin family protein [Phycisphaerae bacterium]|nr:thioredoxin family protein [Saprospiraceae bacterium]